MWIVTGIEVADREASLFHLSEVGTTESMHTPQQMHHIWCNSSGVSDINQCCSSETHSQRDSISAHTCVYIGVCVCVYV